MSKSAQIESLLRRIVDERRRIALAAAEGDTLPPAKLLSHLADLDRAASAIESVMEEGQDHGPSAPATDTIRRAP